MTLKTSIPSDSLHPNQIVCNTLRSVIVRSLLTLHTLAHQSQSQRHGSKKVLETPGPDVGAVEPSLNATWSPWLFDSPLFLRKVGSMKNQILWMPLILIALFAASAVSTPAQTATGVGANVPFDFVVGDKTIPAGRIIASGGAASIYGPLTIANYSQGKLASRNGRRMLGAGRTTEGKLVFHKYGNRYFLAQIWIPGFQAWEVLKSKEERSCERNMRLVKNFKPTPVVVAASLE